jgi:hypothetical protein
VIGAFIGVAKRIFRRLRWAVGGIVWMLLAFTVHRAFAFLTKNIRPATSTSVSDLSISNQTEPSQA